VESDLSFFEIKFKTNKGRTIKKRIKHPQIEETIHGDTESFLCERTTLSANEMEAKLWVNFDRITLVNRFSPERVTIDMNLVFKNNGAMRTMNNLVIAETKQEKGKRSEFVRMMKDHHIREGSLSKYCYAVSSLFNDQKHNNFKPRIKQFKKLLNDTVAES
jgi:hypothetical protein